MDYDSEAHRLAVNWYYLFNRYAQDLYPGRYTWERCRGLAEMAVEIRAKAKEKNSSIFVHNYLYPEFHEIADMVGDSLGLSQRAKVTRAPRVDFQSVSFMAQTAKIIAPESRVYTPDDPRALGCSLVFGTDYNWLESWKRENPDGILVTYINSDAYVKSISDYISTSRNTDKIIVHAAKMFPGQKILVLPDKFLGYVMKAKAVEQGVDPKLVEIYQYRKPFPNVANPGLFEHWNAACYVHEEIGMDAAEAALAENPEAELMIHPECGCASACMVKLQEGVIPRERAYFLSTEGMLEQARSSPARKFIVATEKGMVYRLRKELPEKEFLPVSNKAECRYMKANIFEKLLNSLNTDRLEIVICDDCCDPKTPHQDDLTIHIQRSVAEKARIGIERMLAIQ